MITLWMAMAAHASPGYPAELETVAGMPCAPQCTVCHTTNGGGSGTVTAAFGTAMVARGLDGGSQNDLVVTALDAMTTDAVDSDGDGTIDVDELAVGDDPNGGAPYCDAAAVQYGCLSHAPAPLGAGVGLAVGLAVLRRRRVTAAG
ncbi:MAG: hypothetical protein ABMB14_30230 [Myxococcota bacterium]